MIENPIFHNDGYAAGEGWGAPGWDQLGENRLPVAESRILKTPPENRVQFLKSVIRGGRDGAAKSGLSGVPLFAWRPG